MVAIKSKNLSKKYTLYPDPKYLFREIFHLQNTSSYETKWAVKDLNFSIPSGQVCGLIGMNGSGKSTLLGLISGIISPTKGQIRTKGKVSSLLELGAGFETELSGRENIFLKASILGMSKKNIKSRLDEIIAFSRIGLYIDKPVKTYSSGMMLRLGFSIAIQMNFDILVIDEILSVGDLLFQRKCLSKMRQFKKQGKTILMSSHNLADISALCDRILLIDEGKIVMDGPIEEVIKQYYQECDRVQNQIQKRYNPFKAGNKYGKDTGEIKITRVQFFNEEGKETNTFETEQKMVIRIGYNAKKAVKNPLFRIQFFRNDGLWVHGVNTYRQGLNLGTVIGEGVIELHYEKLNLLEADYFLNIGIWPDEYTSMIKDIAFDLHEFAYIIHMKSRRDHGGGIVCNPYTWKLISNKHLTTVESLKINKIDELENQDFFEDQPNPRIKVNK